jgi:hypothetical protein
MGIMTDSFSAYNDRMLFGFAHDVSLKNLGGEWESCLPLMSGSWLMLMTEAGINSYHIT